MRELGQRRGLMIARIFFYAAAPFALFMIYWSSLEKETQLLELRRQVVDLNNELSSLINNWQFQNLHQKQLKEVKSAPLTSSKDVISLFQPDPFYESTLPKLINQHFRIAGRRVQPFLTKPDNFHPLNNNAQISQLWDLCMRSMGRTHVGFYDRLAPSLATQIELRPRAQYAKDHSIQTLEKTGEFWVFLRQDLFWDRVNISMFPDGFKLHDHFLQKQPVTAWDVKFYYDAIMNPHVEQGGAIAQREFFQDIESLDVIDDYTLRVRWKLKTVPGNSQEKAMIYAAKFRVAGLRPLPRFVYQYYPDGSKIVEDDSHPDTYRTNSVWAQVFMDHWAQNVIIGCGDWILSAKTSNEMLFKRNTFAPDPYGALNEELDFRIRESPDGMWQDFKDNITDLCPLGATQQPEKERFLTSETYKKQQVLPGNTIHELRYVSRAFTFIGWNLKHPLFQQKRVRQALTMAIDREGIIRQILSGQGVVTTGPFHIASPSYDKTIQAYPYDPIHAAQILEELGWKDTDRDGIRENVIESQKVIFSFHLTYFVKNPIGKMICETVAESLRKVGIQCILNGLDIADFSKSMDEKSFDAFFMGWLLGPPPESIRQLWHSSSATSYGSSNCVGFQNPRSDEIIELLDYTYDNPARISLYHEMHRILHDEQPYTFMYCPISVLLHRDRLKNVFLPIERQDLIPGAQSAEPQMRLFYIDPQEAMHRSEVTL